MKAQIHIPNKEQKQFVHDYLHCELSGVDTCLSGSCVCLCEHVWLENYLHFDLTEEQIAYFNETFAVSGIAYATPDIIEPSIEAWTKLDATYGKTYGSELSYTSRTNEKLVPHSMVFSQVPYNDRTKPEWTNRTPISLSSVDCSNVDIIIVDTGVDPTHPDISGQVVNFDWSVLKNGADGASGAQIIASLDPNYNRDLNGHGTACASLAAGKYCGFAKNAKIYSMRMIQAGSEGIPILQGLQLLLAFQKAKKNNKHGLVSTRPTIMSNSWGQSSSFAGMCNWRLQQRASLAGKSLSVNPFSFTHFCENDYLIQKNANACHAVVNAYAEAMIAEGAHFLTAAGNSNHLIGYETSYPLSAHPAFARFSVATSVGDLHYYTPYTVTAGTVQGIDSTFTNGTSYPLLRETASKTAVNLTYDNNGGLGFSMPANLQTTVTPASLDPLSLTCKSPAGSFATYLAATPNACIIVGDATPIGPFMPFADAQITQGFSASNAVYCYNGLSALDTATGLQPGSRHSSLSGVEYVKTQYSCFGPMVDIYACGNATWAAHSNQASAPGAGFPVNTISSTEKYKFFNGTSAATPVAAGCLATYLAEYPGVTPIAAKRWLLNNAVSGSILETDYFTISVQTKSIDLLNNSAGPNITVTYDCPFSPAELTTNADIMNSVFNTAGQSLGTILGQGAYQNLTTSKKVLSLRTAHQFFKSNNLMVQAYPLRKVLLEQDGLQEINNNSRQTFSFLNTNFDTLAPTPVKHKKTHSHSQSLIV